MKFTAALSGLVVLGAAVAQDPPRNPLPRLQPPSKQGGATRNAILFVGDGMGIATLTATRIHSVGVSGRLAIDQLPFTALAKVYAGDYITPDSASTMASMLTGRKGNFGVVCMDEGTERGDFNRNGDGQPTTTLIELAKAAGKSVGILTTDEVVGATPACCYAHTNNRDNKLDIILQALPLDPNYNRALNGGIDLLAGGGRGYCVPDFRFDEEGEPGLRPDRRDLRGDFQRVGYSYIWNRTQWYSNPRPRLPLIALFDHGAMDYERDRDSDVGGNPGLPGMVLVAMQLLASDPDGYLLIVEGGRIDHAHHLNNAWRAISETEQFDQAVGTAVQNANLGDTLIVVTADHGHVFHINGYPMRPRQEIPYAIRPPLSDNFYGPPGDLFSIAFYIDPLTGFVRRWTDSNGSPFTVLGYGNGPGFRVGGRTDPFLDRTPGFGGVPVFRPTDPNYMQEAAVPISAATHGGADVSIHAIGQGSSAVRGVVDNTFVFTVVRNALGI